MSKTKHEVIIISDIHLGSNFCKDVELLDFLQKIDAKKLILNGDIFEDLKKIYRLKKGHWKILAQLRKMSWHCEVLFNIGNHDVLYGKRNEDLTAISNLIGIKTSYTLIFDVGNLKCIALHGDKYDNYLYKHPRAAMVITWIYDRLKDIRGNVAYLIMTWVKRKSKILMRNNEFVKNGAVNYAKSLESSAVFCGHTHHAELVDVDGIVYGNSGTFESAIPTYLAIDEDKVSLYRFDNKKSILLNSIDITKGEING